MSLFSHVEQPIKILGVISLQLCTSKGVFTRKSSHVVLNEYFSDSCKFSIVLVLQLQNPAMILSNLSSASVLSTHTIGRHIRNLIFAMFYSLHGAKYSSRAQILSDYFHIFNAGW